jgi:glycosyltransferase involved in cell wall biosynthesis
MRVIQFVDVFSDHDGIGNDIKGFDELFKENKVDTQILTRVNNSKSTKISLLEEFKSKSDDINILHYGGAGFPLDFFFGLNGKKILRFHNITPIYRYTNFIDKELLNSLEKNYSLSELELFSMNENLDWIFHDSKYNQKCYHQISKTSISSRESILPILRKYSIKNDSKTNSNLAFVGRWAPNKHIEDILFLFYFYKKLEPNSKLLLIGKKNRVFQKYTNYIESCISNLNLTDSVQIFETLNDEEVNEKLSSCKFYISMSDHEGFGIPILEAIAKNLLVIAYRSKAIQEIIQGNLIFKRKNFPVLAELIYSLNQDNEKYSLLKLEQKKRLDVYLNYPFKEMIFTVINKL